MLKDTDTSRGDIPSEPVRGGTGDPALHDPVRHRRIADLAGRYVSATAHRPAHRAPPRRCRGRRATYALSVTGWLLGPKGRVHPGVLAFLAGAPLFGAVQSTLPPRMSSTRTGNSWSQPGPCCTAGAGSSSGRPRSATAAGLWPWSPAPPS